MTDRERESEAAARGRGLRLPRQFGIWLLAGATLAIAGIAVYLAFVADLGDDLGSQPDEELIAEFRGQGDDVTESFTVDDRWEIRWESQGEQLEIHLIGDGGEEQVVTREGPGGGSTYPNQMGTFELRVEADGDWWVRIFEVPLP